MHFPRNHRVYVIVIQVDMLSAQPYQGRDVQPNHLRSKWNIVWK